MSLRNATRQFDLFEDDAGVHEAPRPALQPTSRPRRRAHPAMVGAGDGDHPSGANPALQDMSSGELSPDDMALRLEAQGDFRILRRLQPRPVIARNVSAYPRLAVIVDTETTGLRHDADEVIEIGAVAFTYDDNGAIGDVVGVYGALQQPSGPIPAEITRLTGITDAMVAGQHIDIAQLEALLEPADLIIAHNAGFDRPFCEGLTPMFAHKPWGCSVKETPWRDYGFEGNKLGYLVGQAGLFHEGHRAVDDCHALLEVLARPVTPVCMDDAAQAPEQVVPFAALLAASQKVTVRIWAERSPFDMKDQLKARGYRWSDGADGRPKSWWTEVDEDACDEELRFLRDEIYQWPDASPHRQLLSAMDRYRKP